MNILVIGSGGREYAIIKSLLKSENNLNIYVLGEYINPGILQMTKGFKVITNFNVTEFLNFIEKISPRFVVVGPEKYLDLRVGEILYNQNIPCIGPMGIMAKIETSKIFCRHFLKDKYSEYSPEYLEINYEYDREKLLESFNKFNNKFVLKPNGLTGGKGVKLYDNQNEDAILYVKELLKKDSYILLEERLEGEEFILLSFCDGKNIKHMPLVKDFKRVSSKSDVNTGSMGCIIQNNHKLPFLTDEDIDISHLLNKNVMDGLSRYHEYGYRGILYGSYMKTQRGVKLIEFNARFGDPEVIPVLDLLETQLFDIFDAICLQKLDKIDIKFRNEYSLCKYMVPEGYPTKPLKEKVFSLSNLTNEQRNKVYLAGVKSELSNLIMTGSRTLAVCASGSNSNIIYEEVERIVGKIVGQMFHRSDIKNDFEENISLYKKAGVNIEEGNKVVNNIRTHLESTYDENVLTQWGDFGGLYNLGTFLQKSNYKEPIMVSSTDGVGTKTCFILNHMERKEGMKVLGQDIVNHCVNDILVKGAIPMMFLDYFASSQLDSELVTSFVEGVGIACRENNCCLMGGETAEMPGVYNDGKCDIVGTIMGIVDKSEMIMGVNDIEAGHLVYGIESSGPHTNGYSLIRKIYDENPILKVFKSLLNPHRSYLKEILKLKEAGVKIGGLCHITGGGFYDNIPRVLSENLSVELNLEIKSPFRELGEASGMSLRELLTVFNCGYGMLIFVAPEFQGKIDYKLLGRVKYRENGESVIVNCK
jgi:phosphoribosylamine--glycine ligase/phosphoribosylaminoimidazole synthetase